MSTEHLERLEFRLAHLEQAIQQLSDVLYRQQREIDALRDRGQQLLAQLEQLEGRSGDPGGVEIPPHY